MNRAARVAHLLTAMFAMLVLVLASPRPSYAAPSTRSFYTGSGTGADTRATVVNDAPVVADGISYALYYTDESGQTSNFGNTVDTDVTRMNKSIVDVDNNRGLTLVLAATNTADGPRNLGGSLSLPLDRYTGRHDDEALITGSGAVSITSSNTASTATAMLAAPAGLTSGVLPIADVSAAYVANGGTWADLRAVNLAGQLAPGEAVTVAVLLEATNISDAILHGVTYSNARYRNNAKRFNDGNRYLNVNVRFARQVTYEDADGTAHGLFESTGKYLAGTRDNPVEYRYTQVPADIQALLPNITKSDIYLNNILYMNRHAATVDDVLYTGGNYYINLDRVKAAVRDRGYSVATGTSARGLYLDLPGWVQSVDADLTDDLYGEYSYMTTGAANIASNTGDGSEVPLNTEDASGAEIGSLYLELRPVITTRDLTLNVGDSWTAADNLVSMVDHGGAAVDPADAERARVVHNVDTSKPGVYQVRFYYYHRGDAAAAGDDYEASNIATVTVKGASETPCDDSGTSDS